MVIDDDYGQLNRVPFAIFKLNFEWHFLCSLLANNLFNLVGFETYKHQEIQEFSIFYSFRTI